MSENNTPVVNEAVEKDLRESFIPQVHVVGRSTMAIAFVLAFLPVLYFVFVKGYAAPLSSYMTVAVTVASVGLGMWISEPVAYWPVLGSAGTYIGYLSGNVGAMRFPVALNLQNTMNANINTARGQMVTIIGIVASVYANLVLLLASVLAGDWLLGVLPAAVMASFSFVMVGLIGSMVVTQWNGKDGILKGFLNYLPYYALAIALKFISGKIPFLFGWEMLVCVAGCVALAYVFYKRDCAKDAKEGK